MRDLLTEDHDWYIARTFLYRNQMESVQSWKETRKWLATLDWRKKDCRTCEYAPDCDQCNEHGKPIGVCSAWFPMSCEVCGEIDCVTETSMGLRCPDCFGLERD
jgi:hypothetical protein